MTSLSQAQVDNATSSNRQSMPRRAAWRRIRGTGRPSLRVELALIVLGYGLYSLVRNAVPTKRSLGYAHARTIVHIESVLHIDGEQAVNHALNRIGPLIVGMNYYYAVFHFVITIGVLVWVYVQHPLAYRASRTWLFATTVLALAGFYAYPLAPPRLLPGAGFIDTLVVHHTWGSLASGELAKVSNQYAAMPSMHIGWSLWCALTVFSLTKRTWLKRAALAYPLFTLAVIIGTANHFFLDAAGGVLTLAAGAFATRLILGRAAPHVPQIHRLPGPNRVGANGATE